VSLYEEAAQYTLGMNRDRVGHLLRNRRNLLRLSLQEVAESVGMSKGGVGHIETGLNSTSTDTLEDLATALHARWELRLVGVEEPERDPLRMALVDKLDSVVDLFDIETIRILMANLEIYEAAARSRQGQTRT
jgi:transcriptional regulator with XRE-family HTH domain